MKLEVTRRADLAVRSLVALGATATKWKSAELAEHLRTTLGYVPQVLAPLIRAGWVTSDTGPTGGYLANFDASAVTVLEVIEAVDGPTDDGRCVVENRPCDAQTPCTLHGAWTKARGELVGALARTTLGSLIGAPNGWRVGRDRGEGR